MTINPHPQTYDYRQTQSAEARRAALIGTRAMIANEQFAALVTFLVDLRVCSGEEAGAMLERLGEKIANFAQCAWQSNHQELRLHADWLKRLAARVWARRS